jgi:hypothetical protein
MAPEPAPPAPPDARALAAVRAALESAGVPASDAELAALVPAFHQMRARAAAIEVPEAAVLEPAPVFVPGGRA